MPVAAVDVPYRASWRRLYPHSFAPTNQVLRSSEDGWDLGIKEWGGKLRRGSINQVLEDPPPRRGDNVMILSAMDKVEGGLIERVAVRAQNRVIVDGKNLGLPPPLQEK